MEVGSMGGTTRPVDPEGVVVGLETRGGRRWALGEHCERGGAAIYTYMHHDCDIHNNMRRKPEADGPYLLLPAANPRLSHGRLGHHGGRLPPVVRSFVAAAPVVAAWRRAALPPQELGSREFVGRTVLGVVR